MSSIFTLRWRSVITAARVASLPVPAVVGTAIKGRGGARKRSTPSYSGRRPPLVASAAVALAVSITLPPPMAITPSQSSARRSARAPSTNSSTGSLVTPP